MTRCLTCGRDWEIGNFSKDCEECGGGALERSCPMCLGKCNAVWKKMLIDTHDESLAQWAGSCTLPPEELKEIQRQYVEKLSKTD